MTTITIPSIIIVVAFAALLAVIVGAAIAGITEVEKAFKAHVGRTDGPRR